MTDTYDSARDYFRDVDPGDTETPDDAAPAIDEADELAQLARCDWHLRRLAKIRHEIDVHDAVYRAERERLHLRHLTRLDRLTAAAARHEAPLTSYMAMRRETDGIKSLELPHGTLKSRTATKPTVTVDDEAAVIAWAADVLPDVVVPRDPTIDRRALTAYVVASGEIPDGVTVTSPTTTYTITTIEDTP